jgi:hypothetical protein
VPYPTDDPPPVHETVTRSQGIKGATDPKRDPLRIAAALLDPCVSPIRYTARRKPADGLVHAHGG